MLEAVRVFIHVTDVRKVLLLQVGVDALADANQAVLVAAGNVEELQLLRCLLEVGHKFSGRFRVRRTRKAADPREGVESSGSFRKLLAEVMHVVSRDGPQ